MGATKIGLLFIHLSAEALFSSNLPVSSQFREFLSLFNVQEHSFHQFQGYKTSWRAINIDFPLHAEVNNLIVFAQLGDFDYFSAEKHPNWGNWAYNFLVKLGLL